MDETIKEMFAMLLQKIETMQDAISEVKCITLNLNIKVEQVQAEQARLAQDVMILSRRESELQTMIEIKGEEVEEKLSTMGQCIEGIEQKTEKLRAKISGLEARVVNDTGKGYAVEVAKLHARCDELGMLRSFVSNGQAGDQIGRAKRALTGGRVIFAAERGQIHPIQFLNLFQRICDRHNVSPDERLELIRDQCLEGRAAHWFGEQDFEGFEPFLTAFAGRFWGSREHDMLLDEVNAEQAGYSANEQMSEYIKRMVQQVNFLPHPMTDEYLAKRLIRKLPAELRNVLLAANIITTAHLIRSIANLEDEGSSLTGIRAHARGSWRQQGTQGVQARGTDAPIKSGTKNEPRGP
jgi:hypothetical protein